MLEGSLLIIGDNQEKIDSRLGELKEKSGITSANHPDLLVIKNEAKSIGIDKIREAHKFLVKNPQSAQKKLLIIEDADKLTIEAQNAFLKVLEEPQSTSQIILITKSEENLLPTIISRCQKFFAKKVYSPKPPVLKIAQAFIESGVGERLSIIEEHKDTFTTKEGSLEFLDALLFAARAEIKKENRALIDRAMTIRKDLSTTNVNPRLAIENLALN